MTSERVRAVLGVWMPMVVGLGIMATSVNFYLTAPLIGGFLEPELEPWRLVCSAGAFFVGGVMILSTYGRYKKAKQAKMEAVVEAPSPPR